MLDDDFDFARDRWLRNLKLMQVFRVGPQDEGLALVDRWLEVALPLLAQVSDSRQAARDLFVPLRPGAGDVRALAVGSGRTFADAGANRFQVAGGACYASSPQSDGRPLVQFNVTATAADPEESLETWDYTLMTSWPLEHCSRRAELIAAADDLATDPRLVYGQVGAGLSLPALLQMHPRCRGPRQAWRRHCLIGYDWITYVRPDLAAQVKLRRLEQANEQLYEVRELADETLRLQATEHPAAYDRTAVRAMFQSLVDVLPDGIPEPEPTGSTKRPWLWEVLTYEDPADLR